MEKAGNHRKLQEYRAFGGCDDKMCIRDRSRGINNPSWWPDSNTQFGELVVFSITDKRTMLNGKVISRENLNSLRLKESNTFSISMGVDKNSEFPGGMNLFGKNFGNYAQDIRIEIRYK